MIEKLKNNSTVLWTLTTLSLIYTLPLTLISLYEYYVVGIKKDVSGYPFGHEGPVAGIDYYQNADLYSRHVLTWGLIGIAVTSLIIYLMVKRKTIPAIVVFLILVCFIIYNLATNDFQLD